MGNYVPSMPGRNQPSKAVRIAKRLAAALLVIACIVVLAYFALTHVMGAIDSSFGRDEGDMALSERTVLSNLNSSSVTPPDLSGYHLIETGNLIGPRFENISIGETEEGAARGHSSGAFADVEKYREVTSTATYRNSSVSVALPLTQHYVYDKASNTWVPGEMEYGTPAVSPLRAPTLMSIEAELPALLTSYDANLASRMEGFDATFDSAMDESGGKVTAKLSKTSSSKVLTCNVDLWVSWLDGQGWQVSVTSASAVKETAVNAASSSSSAAVSARSASSSSTGSSSIAAAASTN